MSDTKTSATDTRAARFEERALHSVELRENGDGVPLIVGHAAVFNEETVIMGLFREVVRPSAFDRAIAERQDVVAWYGHGRSGAPPLGASWSGTLTLAKDDRGLFYTITPPDTQSAREVVEAIRRRDVKGSSFAFDVPNPDGERWDYSETKDGKLPLRELLDVDLFDVAPVVFPAYEGTTTGLRSAEDVFKEHRETDPAEQAPADGDPKSPDEAEQAPDSPVNPGSEAERARQELERLSREVEATI